MFMNNPQAIGIYSIETFEIIEINEAACHLYGYKRAELKKMKVTNLIPIGYEAKFRDFLAQNTSMLNEGQCWKMITKSGDIRIVETASHLINYKGIPARHVMIIDITEQKKAEIELKENEAFISHAEEIAKMGSWGWDPIRGIGFWSKNLFQLLKVDPTHTDLSFDFFKGLIHPDDLHCFDDYNDRLFSLREKIVMEIRMLLPNNGFIWVENHVEPVYENDLLVNIRGVIIDMTERKESENELLKLSKAIEQSPVSVLMTDTDGNIEYINPKFTEITGFERHEIIGKNPRILKSSKMDEQVYIGLWATISSGRDWKGELVNKNKSGEFYWENKSISPIIDEMGDIINYISIGEDITLKKKTEAALLEAKEKAEESSRLKSTFLAIISHELRTPLNPIIGFSSILKESSTDEMVIGFASLINNSGNEMLKLIEDLFDLSFSRGQNVKCNNKPILYIDLYYIALAYLEEIIINSGKSDQIEIISIDHQKIIHYEIEVDQAKVVQVLSILFKNAVKFIHHGEIEFGAEIDKDINTIRLFVRDTGIGIEEEKIKIIFNRFRQANDSNSRSYDGLGIGLSIAKQLINIMGGTIEVESQIGKGSTFSFTIPVYIKLKEEIGSSNNLI